MDKKEIEVFIKKLNQSQIERMKRDYADGDIGEDIEESWRFRGRSFDEWSVNLTIPEPILDLLPEWEQGNWWEVNWIIDSDNEGIVEDMEEALRVYGVKSEEEMNPIFCRRYYELDDEQTKWWENLEDEYRDKIDLPFNEVFFES